MTAIAKYVGFTFEDAEEVKKATESTGTFFKLKSGKNQLRICPARQGSKPVVVTYNHFVELIPGDKTSKINFNCPKKMARRPCPICAKAEKLINTGSKSDRDRAFELFPTCRVYTNVIDRRDEDAGAQVFAFGKTVLGGLQIIHEDSGDFCNPGPDGFDIIVRKTGEGMTGTKYAVTKSDHKAPLLDDASAMSGTIDMVTDLSTFARVPSNEEMADMIAQATGKAAPERGRNSGNEQSGSPRAAPSRQSKAVDLDEPIDAFGEDVDNAEDNFQ